MAPGGVRRRTTTRRTATRMTARRPAHTGDRLDSLAVPCHSGGQKCALPPAGSRLDRQSQITAALCSAVEEGSSGPACDELMALVYDDLRRIAASFLRYERKGHSLSPTDLVHEAYTKLIDQTRVDWRGRPTSAPSRARPCGGSWSTTPGVKRAYATAGPGSASRSIPPPWAKATRALRRGDARPRRRPHCASANRRT